MQEQLSTVVDRWMKADPDGARAHFESLPANHPARKIHDQHPDR